MTSDEGIAFDPVSGAPYKYKSGVAQMANKQWTTEEWKVYWQNRCGAAENRILELECRTEERTPQPMDSAPKDRDGILAYSPSFYQNKGGWVAAVWHRDGWHSNPGGWRFEPTHWMPLPASPGPGERRG